MSHPSSVVFYVGAHQDDWQLFMSPQALADLKAENTRVVFIYITAGDAGEDNGWWQGRRDGALSSIQFARRLPIAAVAPEMSTVNDHPIECYTIANTRSYCLGLPDGNMDGSGFSATGNQSIQQLQEGRIPVIDVLVDQNEYQTSYASWQDLVTTVKAILDLEAADATSDSHWVHILDPHVSKHSDHKFTGIIVADAIADDVRYRQAMYEEYATPDKEANVTGVDLVLKSGLYLFYAQTAFERSGVEEHFSDWHLSFLLRQYRTQ